MRYKILIFLSLLAGSLTASAQAATDTIYNPTVIFNGVPRNYELAGITVSGAENYEDYIVIGYTGLRVGQRIDIPGNDITQAVKRLMRQSLFAQAQIKVEKIADGKVWLDIAVRPQPRISEVNYTGMKKGERDDLQKMLQLMKGSTINQNIKNRATSIVKK